MKRKMHIAIKSFHNGQKFLTWCTYKVGVHPLTPKKWGSAPTKITPMCVNVQSSWSEEAACSRRIGDAADHLEWSQRRGDHDRWEGGRLDSRPSDGSEVRRTRSAPSVARTGSQARRTLVDGRDRDAFDCCALQSTADGEPSWSHARCQMWRNEKKYEE